MLRERYSNKLARDARFADLKAQGRKVRRSSTRNQLLDPRYVADIGGPDLGLANTTRFFAVLYTVEEDRW